MKTNIIDTLLTVLIFSMHIAVIGAYLFAWMAAINAYGFWGLLLGSMLGGMIVNIALMMIVQVGRFIAAYFREIIIISSTLIIMLYKGL